MIYFKQVFDSLRTTMFILGMVSVFIGISLLAPDEVKGNYRWSMVSFESPPPTTCRLDINCWGWILSGGDIKDTPLVSVTAAHSNDADRYSTWHAVCYLCRIDYLHVLTMCNQLQICCSLWGLSYQRLEITCADDADETSQLPYQDQGSWICLFFTW